MKSKFLLLSFALAMAFFPQLVSAEEGAPFFYWDFNSGSGSIGQTSGSFPGEPDDTYGSEDVVPWWVTANEASDGSVAKWREGTLTGPSGNSDEGVALYERYPHHESQLRQALMQVAEIPGGLDYYGVKKLNFNLILNNTNSSNDVPFHIEVFGIKHEALWESGYFRLEGAGATSSTGLPGWKRDVTFHQDASVTLPASDYDVLLDTYLLTETTHDSTVTASTWQALSLDVDFGLSPADPEFPELDPYGLYSQIVIRFTANADWVGNEASDVGPQTIAIDKVTIVDGAGPTSISLDNSTLDENSPVSTLVGNLSATDADAGETFTFTLVSGASDTDNSLFTVSGNQLLSNHVFDYENQTSASIRLKVENSSGLTHEQSLSISIEDLLDQAPTDLVLSSTEIAEGEAIGTFVGAFSVTDPDAELNEVDSISLVAGEGDVDNALFGITIQGSTVYLSTGVVFDYEVQSTASVRIKVTDPQGNCLEKQFAISVLLDGSVDAQEQFDTATEGSGLPLDQRGTDDEPFNDGVENLLKYAFNMDLSGPDNHQMEQDGDSGEPGGGLVEVEGQAFWRVQYVVRRDSGLTYTPLRTNSLTQAFEPMTGEKAVEVINSEWLRVTLDQPCDPATAPQCFSSVEVSISTP